MRFSSSPFSDFLSRVQRVVDDANTDHLYARSNIEPSQPWTNEFRWQKTQHLTNKLGMFYLAPNLHKWFLLSKTQIWQISFIFSYKAPNLHKWVLLTKTQISLKKKSFFSSRGRIYKRRPEIIFENMKPAETRSAGLNVENHVPQVVDLFCLLIQQRPQLTRCILSTCYYTRYIPTRVSSESYLWVEHLYTVVFDAFLFFLSRSKVRQLSPWESWRRSGRATRRGRRRHRSGSSPRRCSRSSPR